MHDQNDDKFVFYGNVFLFCYRTALAITLLSMVIYVFFFKKYSPAYPFGG